MRSSYVVFGSKFYCRLVGSFASDQSNGNEQNEDSREATGEHYGVIPDASRLDQSLIGLN